MPALVSVPLSRDAKLDLCKIKLAKWPAALFLVL